MIDSLKKLLFRLQVLENTIRDSRSGASLCFTIDNTVINPVKPESILTRAGISLFIYSVSEQANISRVLVETEFDSDYLADFYITTEDIYRDIKNFDILLDDLKVLLSDYIKLILDIQTITI